MDPVRTEIMKNRLTAIVEEAASVAYRSAHTTYVKQTQDFRVALATVAGEFFACPVQNGVTTGVGHSVRPTVDVIGLDTLVPGDVIITNDPFSSGGLCTHTMDIHLVRPVFRGRTLVCFAWSFIHASDIGGAVPGSISPAHTEVFQEGLRLRPLKLYKAGTLNEEIVAILRDNSRIPDEIWGDLQAMLSAMALLDRRINELADRVGLRTLHAAIADVMDLAELKARAAIARLADGTYTFADYLEGQEPGTFIFLQARLVIRGDEATLDFDGSDPAAQASLNFCTSGPSHPFLSLALTNMIQTMEPDIPINGGMQRPIHARAPLGTVMNAAFPAAMGNRWVAVMRVYDAVMGCIAQAVPGGLVACGAGQAGIVTAAWTDVATGRRRVSVVEPFCGGSGGRCVKDGVDATDSMIGFLKSTPVEAVEVDTPLIVRAHALEPDSFGHGRFRGGAAVRLEIEARAAETIVTVRGLDRFRFQPWGAQGGGSGRNGHTVLNPGTDRAQPLGKIRVLTMARGDLLRMVSPSGGGFGDPLDRDPALVLRDVRGGLLGAALAHAAYGVVVVDGTLDAEATAAERARRSGAPRPPAAAFDLGPERLALERRWTNAAAAALARGALALPPGIRAHVFASARRALEEAPAPITAAQVDRVLESLARPFAA